MKTLNTGTQSNQTQIKTTDALRNLISAANTNNTNTTNINLKQVILTPNKSQIPKVILVPNNNVKNNQIEDLTNTTASDVSIQQQSPPIVQYQLSSSSNNTRVIMPKITTISTTANNNPSLQKFVFLKSSSSSNNNNMVDTKSLKIITQPVNLNDSALKQPHQFLTTSKPIILNNYFKESFKIHNNEVF